MLLVKIHSKHKITEMLFPTYVNRECTVYYNSSFIILSPMIKFGAVVTEMLRNYDTVTPRYRYTVTPLHYGTVIS